jgi:hypothetical protein
LIQPSVKQNRFKKVAKNKKLKNRPKKLKNLVKEGFLVQAAFLPYEADSHGTGSKTSVAS